MVSTGISQSAQNQRSVRVFACDAREPTMNSVKPKARVSTRWFLKVKHVNAQLLTAADSC